MEINNKVNATEKKTCITVGLMGHSFHCSNLGVGALALSECAILQKIADELSYDLKIICFESGWNEFSYVEATKTDVEQVYYTYLPKMIKQFKRCDLILDVTGGDSFSDIYGDKIFIAGMILKSYAILSRKSVILAPQTIGPFAKKRNYFWANAYMRYVKKIFLRDTLSINAISNYNKRKVQSVADMAFRLPYQRTGKRRKVVGFNVSGLLYDKNNRLVNREGFSYEKLCDEIVKMLLLKDYKIVLVSHVIGNETEIIDNDYCASLLLKQKYPELEVAPLFQTPIEAKNYISQLELFIGSRMHAVIAAVSSGVPAIPIAYSRKFKGVFEPLGYDITIDATVLRQSEVVNQVKYDLEHIESLKTKVAEAQTKADILLNQYEKAIKDELKEL